MNSIEFNHFKAFSSQLIVSDFSDKNLLICGENGSGKSSIFDGIKLAAYYETLKRSNVTTPVGSPIYDNSVETWLSTTYQNKKDLAQRFTVKIDDVPYKDYSAQSLDSIFMICHKDIISTEKIVLKDLLSGICFPVNNVDDFLNTETVSEILASCNSVFAEKLFEKLTISTEPQDGEGYVITIEDSEKKPKGNDHLISLFNEAKHHLVKLTILLETAKKLPIDEGRKKVLVLDDIISSLDAGNRTFLINYIVEDFSDFQKIILTHNVGFFNLVRHVVNNNFAEQIDKWSYRTLYELGDDSGIYEYKKDVVDIKNLLQEIKDCRDDEGDEKVKSLGNRLRKKFEMLTIELAHLFLFGDMAVSEDVLNKMASTEEELYMKKNPTGGLDTYTPMLKEIKGLVYCASPNHEEIRTKLRAVFEKYTDHDNLKTLRDTLSSLRLYQKVVMHPMSHGVGDVNFSMKELKMSALLIEQMEKAVNKVYKGNRGNNVNDMN